MRAADNRSKVKTDPLAIAARRLLFVGSTITGVLTILVAAIALLAGVGLGASLLLAAPVAIAGWLAVSVARRSTRRFAPVKVRRQ
jgi:hypothetical protein